MMQKFKEQFTFKNGRMLLNAFWLVWILHLVALATINFWYHAPVDSSVVGIWQVMCIFYVGVWLMEQRSSKMFMDMYRRLLDDTFEAWKMQLEKSNEPHWLIWSLEHDGWWGPNETGYVNHREKAGRYSLEHAVNIVKKANEHPKEGLRINEAIVHE